MYIILSLKSMRPTQNNFTCSNEFCWSAIFKTITMPTKSKTVLNFQKCDYPSHCFAKEKFTISGQPDPDVRLFLLVFTLKYIVYFKLIKNVGKKSVCCAACLYTVYNKNVYNIHVHIFVYM